MSRTFGTLSRDGARWVIGDLEPHVRTRLKSIFPKVPKMGLPPYAPGRENLTTQSRHAGKRNTPPPCLRFA